MGGSYTITVNTTVVASNDSQQLEEFAGGAGCCQLSDVAAWQCAFAVEQVVSQDLVGGDANIASDNVGFTDNSSLSMQYVKMCSQLPVYAFAVHQQRVQVSSCVGGDLTASAILAAKSRTWVQLDGMATKIGSMIVTELLFVLIVITSELFQH